LSFIRIFVSSPGDCEPERNVLDEVIARINETEGNLTGRQLKLFKWEDNVIPRLGLAPQDVVDDQTPLCDIYLGIMSSRFGGGGKRASGTEKEFRNALENVNAKTQAWMLFYFNDDPPQPKSVAASKELTRVFKFREEVEKLGIIGTYSGVRGSEKGFFERVEQHLRQLLQRPELSTARLSPTSLRPSRRELVMSKRHLRCGVTKHPPLADYQFTNDRQVTFSGYYVDLARDVAARTGLQVDFVPIQWQEFTSDIFAKPVADPRAIDLVLSVFETSERRDYADFTCNFHSIDLCAVVADDSKIQTLDDLRGMQLRWAVAEGEAGWEYAVRELRIESFNTIVVQNPDIGTALSIVSAAAGDVAVVDRVTAYRYIRMHPQAKIRLLKESVLKFKNGIMVPRQDPDFEAWVRDEFSTSRRSPQIAELESQMITDCGGAVTKYA